MKHLNRRTFNNWDQDEALKVLRREGKILDRINASGKKGCYSAFSILYKKTYWTASMLNGKVYNIGWEIDPLYIKAYIELPLGQKEY